MIRTTGTRKSVPLTESDLEDLAVVRESAELREALASVAGTDLPETASESVLLHTILVAGLRAAQERAQEAGYADLGAEYREGGSMRRKVSRRRPPAWTGDE